MFHVAASDNFLDEVEGWDKPYREEVSKLYDDLAEKPRSGDPLDYPYLREKKVMERRVYFLVYEDMELVLLVAASGKKDQEATIQHIEDQFDRYHEVAEEIDKQLS